MSDVVEFKKIGLPDSPDRQSICDLEEYINSLATEQRRSYTNLHDFAPGIYVKSIFMPANEIIVSKIHRSEHFFIVPQGCCTVVDSLGGKQFISASYLGKTLAGTKRALHIHVDCIWTTFHVTDLTDLEEIEKEIYCESFAQFDAEQTK